MKYNLKDNCLDVFRLLAAINVMLVHCSNMLKINVPESIRWLWDSSLGVSALYLISGFLIYASFDKIENVYCVNRKGRFYFNRFIRIYPPIWFSITILVFLNLFFGNNILNPKYILLTLAEVILPRGGEEYIGDYITNGSLWTVPIELQFYLFFPFMYKVHHFTTLGLSHFSQT